MPRVTSNPIHRLPNDSGFTLVELAIVLVIIGLLIGGILTGTDLIKASEVRATAGQIEKYNSAVNTFRTKFHALPGDIRNPDEFGLDATLPGNGNKVLADTAGDMSTFSGELSYFWRHLGQAQLIDGSYDGAQAGAERMGVSFPFGKINRKGITAYSVGGNNFYHIGLGDPVGSLATFGPALSSVEAHGIDQKVDDGAPNAGQTMARGGVVANGAANTASCTTGSAVGDTYRLDTASVACQLRIALQN